MVLVFFALKPDLGPAKQRGPKGRKADRRFIMLVGQIFAAEGQGEMRIKFPTGVSPQIPIVSHSNESGREDGKILSFPLAGK
jgi:hypothetical protein